MQIAALLPADLERRIRLGAGPHVTVTSLADARALRQTVLTSAIDIAIVDPSLVPPQRARALMTAMRSRGTQFVTYVSLERNAIRGALEFARGGAWELVVRDHNDGPTQIARLLSSVQRGGIASVVVHRLEPQLAALPFALRDAVRSIIRTGYGSIAGLAAAALCTRRSLDRRLTRAGLATSSRLVAAAHTLHAFRLLHDAGATPARVARALRYDSARALNRRVVSVTGISLAALGAGIPARTVVEAVVGAMQRGRPVITPERAA